MTFEEQMMQAVEDSVLKMIRDGGFIMPDYANRPRIPSDKVQDIYAAINWDNVRRKVMDKVEDRCADHILNSMATEIANDVKQVLSNKELREEVRTFVRAGIKRVGESVREEK